MSICQSQVRTPLFTPGDSPFHWPRHLLQTLLKTPSVHLPCGYKSRVDDFALLLWIDHCAALWSLWTRIISTQPQDASQTQLGSNPLTDQQTRYKIEPFYLNYLYIRFICILTNMLCICNMSIELLTVVSLGDLHCVFTRWCWTDFTQYHGLHLLLFGWW